MNSLLLALVLGGLSASKLGPQVMNPADNDALTVLRECPRLAKWVSKSGEVAAAVVDYRLRCPGGVVVLAVDAQLPAAYETSQDAAAAADDYWNRMQGGLAGIDPNFIDWLEGPSASAAIPGWTRDPAKADWYADFWSRLADRMNQGGFHPLVGSIPTGEPALAGEGGNATNLFAPIAEAMKQKTYAWGWSYQAFSSDLSRDVCAELLRTLRYRKIRDECGLAGFPIVISQAGRGSPGWLAAGTSNAAYLEWLSWLDSQTRLDSEVEGVALFQFGDKSAAADFDLAGLTDDLVEHLRAPAIFDGGTPDTCEAADGGGTSNPKPPHSGSEPPPAGGWQPGNWDEGGGCGCSTTGALSLGLVAPLLFPLVRRLRRAVSCPRR